MRRTPLLASFNFVYRLMRSLLVLAISLLVISINALFGKINWQPPAWIATGKHQLQTFWLWGKARPRQMAMAIGISTVLLIGGWQTWIWYQQRPQPVTVSYDLDTPDLTTFENGQWYIDNLLVNFDDSVAPLEQIDKIITSGVSLSPKSEGEWQWLSDRQLRFTPKADWPIDQKYKIEFAKKGLLAANVLLSITRQNSRPKRLPHNLNPMFFIRTLPIRNRKKWLPHSLSPTRLM